MKKKNAIAWLEKPQAKDYPAAATYLSLFHEEARAASCVRKLRGAKTREYRAVDLFRASGLKMDNAHLKEDRKKIRAGKKLSPLLLVRNPAIGRVVIADGYHRLCAVYELDEDSTIACRIVSP